MGEATLGRVLTEILLSFAPTFAALAALLWTGFHAPALVGLVGERGWFRWGVERFAWGALALFGLDLDGVRVAVAWGAVGVTLGSPAFLLLHQASALPAAAAAARRRHARYQAALLLELEVRAAAAGGAEEETARAALRLTGDADSLAVAGSAGPAALAPLASTPDEAYL